MSDPPHFKNRLGEREQDVQTRYVVVRVEDLLARYIAST